MHDVESRNDKTAAGAPAEASKTATESAKHAPAGDGRGASTSGDAAGLQKAFGRVPVALIVEDNMINQRLAVALVQYLGCATFAVDDGAAAVERVKAGGIDIVFMDIQMPGMDGLEATRAIRALSGEARRVPIIAMTAHAMAGSEQQCRTAGMDDFVSKPIDAQRLKTGLYRCLIPGHVGV